MSTPVRCVVVKNSEESRFRKIKKTIIPWTKEEDFILLKGVQVYGENDWNTVAEGVVNRSRKQCRERYFNNLAENVTKKQWSVEEDNMIIQLQREIGNKWTEISKYLPGRAPNSVKNRFCSHILRVIKRANSKTKEVKQKEKTRKEVLNSQEAKAIQKSETFLSVFLPVSTEYFQVI
ncbi:transcription factor WEREWOLF, putative [Entamoeba invadens IP1]|uniref:transcription factor WEREWOLF, putative n=1 Tax=Entamoeba invadens IP1 TaxID=370355 RepID=UPI0002C3F237|nr:transcription factor WEREWOLF, putative [Entamoeba invadens IP1]ELP93917.1 transcription factor WEREWOLF, putative [Entamoeba invadens IP1]|eukprot:XP_004260688.1 transcription factor WEREWOLF, putative [Entamoeba invadens IP1]